jgi:hypothetical protein
MLKTSLKTAGKHQFSSRKGQLGVYNYIILPFLVHLYRARICKRLWSPEIDTKESIQPAYVAWRAGTTNRVVVPARQAGNRFLGSPGSV